MINPPTTEELATLAQSTFADTAFLLTELSPDPGSVAPDWLCAVIGFDAEVKGRLVLAASTALAAQLAADMLCVDAADTQAQEHASGALAEQPVEPLAHLLIAAGNQAVMYIANAPDKAAARQEMGESMTRLLEGLRRARA